MIMKIYHILNKLLIIIIILIVKKENIRLFNDYCMKMTL